MKAIAAFASLPANHPQSLQDITLPTPEAHGHDLLVRVEAISVNPVDTKIRKSLPQQAQGKPKILGWDAAGVVEAVGERVTLFRPGDRVWG